MSRTAPLHPPSHHFLKIAHAFPDPSIGHHLVDGPTSDGPHALQFGNVPATQGPPMILQASAFQEGVSPHHGRSPALTREPGVPPCAGRIDSMVFRVDLRKVIGFRTP